MLLKPLIKFIEIDSLKPVPVKFTKDPPEEIPEEMLFTLKSTFANQD
jgi:hypothetical protein